MADNQALFVQPSKTIIRTRQLPIRGEILVAKGDEVSMETVVAKAEIKGDFDSINAASAMGVSPIRIKENLTISVGDTIKQGQLLGETKALWGLIHNRLIAQVDGVVDEISSITGQLVIAKPSVPLTLLAHLAGVVIETDGRSTVKIKSNASIIQGIFGIGQEAYGRLYPLEETSKNESIGFPSDGEGVVLMIPGPLSKRVLEAAMEHRISGIVAASASGRLLTTVAGTLNPASTGKERIGMTIILTEGFGQMEMAKPCRVLLEALIGKKVSLSGVTQVRAGVIRPELLGPPVEALALGHSEEECFEVGTHVRIVRGEAFGTHGTITKIPPKPQTIPSGVKSFVYLVGLKSGQSIVVPRANVEWISNG